MPSRAPCPPGCACRKHNPPPKRSSVRASRIEDYQFIGGDRLSAARAAQRLGVSKRTIVRYRATLRTTEAASWTP